MKTSNIARIGTLFFLVGVILIMLSWNLSYPIYMADLDAVTFTQFHPLIWPGITLSLTGLFLAGCYSQRKNVKFIYVALFPIILYSNFFFFSYTPTSDSGGVKAMFEIFHQTGINPAAEPYFHYPVFFTLNEMTGQILQVDVNGVASILFLIFGVLLAIYLLLALFKLTENSYQIAFFGVLLYFTGLYFHLNYQWVPQTFALVFFLLLLILFDQKRVEYRLLSIIVFTALVFTHLLIPAIFLVFLGFYSIVKEKGFRNSFLLMTCIYVSVLVYYTTFYFSTIIEVFKQSAYGFGEEYTTVILQSLVEPKGLISQVISIVNRSRIPLTWLIISVGFLAGFIKKRISFTATTLALTGGFCLVVGLFYPVLGVRALQILFIPLVIGVGFFVSKWKKPALTLVTILLILSVFGPLRESYDQYQFQLEEEEAACNFLANTIPTEKSTRLAIGGVNYGYFMRKFNYVNMDKDEYLDLWIIPPRDPEFYNIFNVSMRENEYLLYNSNLGKEVISYGMNTNQVSLIQERVSLYYNKICECGNTFIIMGG